jgi:hypothetical protein
MVVAQALYRRLITPRGKLRGGDEESAYGLDLSGYVGAVTFETALGALPGLIRGELMKDDRVSDVAAVITSAKQSDGMVDLTIVVNVVLSDSGETFALTLGVTEFQTTLLQVAA